MNSRFMRTTVCKLNFIGAEKRVALGHHLVRDRVDTLAKTDGQQSGNRAPRSSGHLGHQVAELGEGRVGEQVLEFS